MKLAGEDLTRRAAGLPDWRIPDFKSAPDIVNRAGGVTGSDFLSASKIDEQFLKR